MATINPVRRIELQEKSTSGGFKGRSITRYFGTSILWIFLIVMALIEFMPVSWLFANSLRNPAVAYNLPPSFLPTSWQWENYTAVVFSPQIRFLLFFWNSVKIGIITTFFTLLTCSLAAFAFARLKFPGKNILFFLFLATLMIPWTVVMIPNFIIISRLDFIDTHWALVLPALTSAFGIFLLRQQFMSLPEALMDAAKIDGAGYFRIFFLIMLPLIGPGLSALGIFTFLGSWNNYLGPLLYLRTTDNFTFPLAIVTLQGYMGTGNRAHVLAGIMISVAPVLAFFLLAQRYIIQGIAITGLKG